MTLETAARLSRAALLAAKSSGEAEALEEIVIGRDVLELVSSAMYIDPMTVYREYVQNAADALDDARKQGLLQPQEEGEVFITIDPVARSIRIRDNGTGLSNTDFPRKMAALGASGKRGTSARGFRGVGRLAGLGYAQELVFRSKTASDRTVSELTWDCRKLKAVLREGEGDIQDLIRSVATLRRRSSENYPDRFFEVELRGVMRLRSDRLMSPAAVHDYLAQVAPVPFAPEFSFGAEIRDALAAVVDLGELTILVEGTERPVYRPHRDVYQEDGGKAISFDRLSVSKISGIDGDIAAVAWVLHHDYEGALPNGAGVKGLRLRSGNVQIGEHFLLEELFPETRFNAWSVGEVHVVDRKIIPNGRRDHFEQNAHYHNLTNQLAPIAREISKHCRTSSVRRKWERDFNLSANTVREALDIIAQGSLAADGQRQVALSADQALMKMEKISRMEIFADEPAPQREVIADLREKLRKAMSDENPVSSPLMRLPEEERQKYESFFELVYECSVNRNAAKALIDKILMRLGS